MFQGVGVVFEVKVLDFYVHDYITGLPLQYDTKIGAEGNGLSQGQKQRILIARAVYRNPDFIFLDEATNALDAGNERCINQSAK